MATSNDSSHTGLLNESLIRILVGGGMHAIRLMQLAVQFNIIEILETGDKNISELSRLSNTHEKTLQRVMRTLTYLGFFDQTETESYRLNQLSRLFLRNAEHSLYAESMLMGETWFWQAWAELSHSLQTGETAFNQAKGKGLFEYLNTHAKASDLFNATLAKDDTESLLLEYYDLSPFNHLIDIGGGEGHIAKILLEHFTTISITLFDLPNILEAEVTHILLEQFKDRLKLVGGDFFQFVPSGGDAYLLKYVLHDWNDSDVSRILSTIHHAMNSESKLLIIERPFVEDAVNAHLLDISMLALTGGEERTISAYNTLMESADFAISHTIDFQNGAVLFECTKR